MIQAQNEQQVQLKCVTIWPLQLALSRLLSLVGLLWREFQSLTVMIRQEGLPNDKTHSRLGLAAPSLHDLMNFARTDFLRLDLIIWGFSPIAVGRGVLNHNISA